MTQAVHVTPEFVRDTQDAVRMQRKQVRDRKVVVGQPPANRATRFRDRAVILDEELSAATNSKTGPKSGKATRLRWSPADRKYIEVFGEQIEVWNHSESNTHEKDTFGVARWIDGHWWFFGDCDAMAERLPDPEEEEEA